MMASLPLRIMLATALLAGGLCGFVFYESVQRDRGTEVQIRVQGVDPRELLTGHSVLIRFVEQRPETLVCFPGDPVHDEPAWLALKIRDGVAVPAGMAGTRESALEQGPLVVRGRFDCAPTALGDGSEEVVVDLGIKRFHAPQKEAEALEDLLRNNGAATDVRALVSIGRDGRARLKGLLIDGERLSLDWW